MTSTPAAGDILWHNDNGAVSIWDNGRSQAPIIANRASSGGWHVAATGDFAPAATAILWHNDNGASIWDNGQIAGAYIIANRASSRTAGVAGTSFDANGHGGILWHNDNGAVSSGITARSQARIIANPGIVPGSWHVAAPVTSAQQPQRHSLAQ